MPSVSAGPANPRLAILETEREKVARLQARNDELTLMLRLCSQFLGDYTGGWIADPVNVAARLGEKVDAVLERGQG